MKIRQLSGHVALALAASLLTAGASVAAPFAITHTGTMNSSNIPGVITGQPYEATLVFDNGGATASSQTWTGGHLKCTIWKFNTARNVVFTQHHSSSPSVASGSASTNATGDLQSNFNDVSNINGSYHITGTTWFPSSEWYMNDNNGIFSIGGAWVGGDPLGVPMAAAGWSNPTPFNGDCNGVYLGTPPAPAAVPTMSEWAMILLGTVLAGLASLTLMRRRQIV